MRSSPLPLLLALALATLGSAQGANLLTSYLPAAMQALAYYIDHLQYEPLSSTTIEPPFSADVDFGGGQSSSPLPPRPSNTPPSTTTTRRPASSTTTRRPAGSNTTQRPASSTPSWWQPPSWWEQPKPQRTSTTTRPTAAPTPPHRPALFAPTAPAGAHHRLEGQALFNEIGDDNDFDRLPLSLIRDIQSEALHDDFTNDVESLDNFLRLYDDNYGRAAFDFESAMDRWSSSSTAGKKRVPPTKPYVDFLLVYDLLKRDAKAANLSKYEGYSDTLLQDLYELSNASAARQLYELFQRMLARGDVQRSDVVARVQAIVKDLANPRSATAKALAHIPPLQFLP